MLPSMRRVLLAATVLIAVSFGVGWVVSGSEQRTGVRHAPAVTHLRPLPVPRVVIPNGPWADPHPTSPKPVRVAPPIPRGLMGELRWLLDPSTWLLAGKA